MNLFFIETRITSARPLLVISPILRAISWRTIVAIIESRRAQRREYPNEAPAIEHKVTVPGPIKAAAIKTPGPTSLIHFIMEHKSDYEEILHLKKVYLFHTSFL